MTARNGKRSEDFDTLIDSVKPKGARYLQEKYQYWMDTSIPLLRKKVASELETETERLLILRAISGVFEEFRTIERTGFTFIGLHPGIEYGGNGARDVPSCDILLRGTDGSWLFLILAQDQRSSPIAIRDLIAGRFRFILDNADGFSEEYGIDREHIRLGLVITGPERQNIRKGLQLLGSTEDGSSLGEVLVLSFSLSEGTLSGLPNHRDTKSNVANPDEKGEEVESPGEEVESPGKEGTEKGTEGHFQLRSAPLDLNAHEYLLFELVVVQGAYADHLIHDEVRPKEFSTRELHTILYREMGISGRDHALPEKIIERRRALARKHLSTSLAMAMRYHIIEDSSGLSESQTQNGSGRTTSASESDDQGGSSGKPGKAKEPYRLICQGTDLTIVRNNLRKKFVDGCGSERAAPIAKRKAVEAYRRRYPRIDRSF